MYTYYSYYTMAVNRWNIILHKVSALRVHTSIVICNSIRTPYTTIFQNCEVCTCNVLVVCTSTKSGGVRRTVALRMSWKVNACGKSIRYRCVFVRSVPMKLLATCISILCIVSCTKTVLLNLDMSISMSDRLLTKELQTVRIDGQTIESTYLDVGTYKQMETNVFFFLWTRNAFIGGYLVVV